MLKENVENVEFENERYFVFEFRDFKFLSLNLIADAVSKAEHAAVKSTANDTGHQGRIQVTIIH